MSFVFSDVKFWLRLRPQSLVGTLIGLGCLRVSLALLAGSGPCGVRLAATAAEWMSCAASLILLALWDWDMQERRPGITSLLRRCSYGAIAGSLLPCAASLLSTTERGAAPALAAALAGLVPTLFSAMLLKWLLRDVDMEAPLLRESLVMARLAALREILEGSALGAGGSGAARTGVLGSRAI
jgi:hypothetical protein